MTSPTPTVLPEPKKNTFPIIIMILVMLMMAIVIIIMGIALYQCYNQPKPEVGTNVEISQMPTTTPEEDDEYSPDTPSDIVLVSQKIDNIELELVMVQEASGFPAILTLKVDGEKQKIGTNRCYTAELSDDAQFLVTQCYEQDDIAPLVIWEFNKNSGTFIRLNETSEVGLIFPVIGSWYDHKFIATSSIEGVLPLNVSLIIMNGDDNSLNMYDIEAGEYGAAHFMPSVPVISPDGQYVLVQAQGNEKLNVYDLEGNKVASYVTVFKMDYDIENDPNWSSLLDYRWSLDGSVIEYKYPLEDESAYRQIFFN